MNNEDKSLTLTLAYNEALVLYDWLSKFIESDNAELFKDQAEERVLWNLEAILEEKLPEVVSSDYKSLLDIARHQVRDKEE